MLNRIRLWQLMPILITLLVLAPAVFAASYRQTGDIPTPGCQWVYSAAGAASFANLLHDTDFTPLSELRLGNGFVSTMSIARNGYLDFEGDEAQDVFRIEAAPGWIAAMAVFTWWYRSMAGSGVCRRSPDRPSFWRF